MKRSKDDCTACQEELALAAGRDELRVGPAGHLTRCGTCQSFAASVEELAHLALSQDNEPPSSLVTRAMERLSPELEARAREAFRLRIGLAVAGSISLPVIVGLNGMSVWLVYTMLDAFLSEPVAVLAAYTVVASTLLGLSLAYGSLPLVADWALHLRQRCHALAAHGSSG